MPRYEYRPRPSKDPRGDCLKAGWRQYEDLVLRESHIDTDLFAGQVELLRNRIEEGELHGTWMSIFQRPVYDLDKTPDGEVLFLINTVEANAILFIAGVTVE